MNPSRTARLMMVVVSAIALVACKSKDAQPPTAPSAGKEAVRSPGIQPEEAAHAGHDHGGEKPAGDKGRDEHEPAGEKGHGEGAGHIAGEGHAGEKGHEEVIRLTPEAVRSAGIQVAAVTRRPLRQHIRASATISLPPDRMGKVAARVPGRIATLPVRTGQQVKRSTVLAVIESPELGRARADYLAAAAKARVGEANFRREKNLFAKGITSEREMREAESVAVTSKADLDAADARLHAFGLSESDINALKGREHYSSRFPVRSPIDGTLLEMNATVGQTIEGAEPLFTVGDLGEVWVLLDIFESQLGHVRAGQHVHVTVGALPDRHFDARVDQVGDVVDEKSRSVKLRVVVPNRDRVLKPGMFATAEIGEGATEHGEGGGTSDAGAPGAGPAVLVVPREAVQQVGADTYVFAPAGEGQFRPLKVRTGRSTAEDVEVVQGLASNSQVVVKGAFILKSELMKESMGEGHAH
jgi:membrane fusion protein, heavy metal efflux system